MTNDLFNVFAKEVVEVRPFLPPGNDPIYEMVEWTIFPMVEFYTQQDAWFLISYMVYIESSSWARRGERNWLCFQALFALHHWCTTDVTGPAENSHENWDDDVAKLAIIVDMITVCLAIDLTIAFGVRWLIHSDKLCTVDHHHHFLTLMQLWSSFPLSKHQITKQFMSTHTILSLMTRYVWCLLLNGWFSHLLFSESWQSSIRFWCS